MELSSPISREEKQRPGKMAQKRQPLGFHGGRSSRSSLSFLASSVLNCEMTGAWSGPEVQVIRS